MSEPNFVQTPVRDFVRQTHSLSPSLLLSKYAQVGRKTGFKEEPPRTKAVKVVCKAVPKGIPAPPVWTGRTDGRILYMTLKSRLMVNMAGGVIENGNLSLHPFTGHPVIPGSAVKGAARHAAWRKWHKEEDTGRKSDYAKALADVFGYPTGDKKLDKFLIDHDSNYEQDTHQAGSVIFLDAHPFDRAPLVEEVLTPHTGENPVPNIFPAVAAGATFVFAMLPARRLSGFDPNQRKQLWTLAENWLREALIDDGIGAKTTAGYGWFEENAAISERLEREATQKREAAAAEREKVQRLAAMNPVDRYLEEFLAMDSEPFAHTAKSAETLDADHQKAFVLAVQARDKKDWWKKKKKRAKKDPKDQAMVDCLRKLAQNHGVELP